MAKKTLADIEKSQKNVRYDELLAILRDNGCGVREGTREGAIADCGGRTVTIPRHHAVLKPVYVRKALRALKGEQ